MLKLPSLVVLIVCVVWTVPIAAQRARTATWSISSLHTYPTTLQRLQTCIEGTSFPATPNSYSLFASPSITITGSLGNPTLAAGGAAANALIITSLTITFTVDSTNVVYTSGTATASSFLKPVFDTINAASVMRPSTNTQWLSISLLNYTTGTINSVSGCPTTCACADGTGITMSSIQIVDSYTQTTIGITKQSTSAGAATNCGTTVKANQNNLYHIQIQMSNSTAASATGGILVSGCASVGATVQAYTTTPYAAGTRRRRQAGSCPTSSSEPTLSTAILSNICTFDGYDTAFTTGSYLANLVNAMNRVKSADTALFGAAPSTTKFAAQLGLFMSALNLAFFMLY